MASKVVIVGPEDHSPTRSPEKGWRVVGWFGLLLLFVGLAEVLSVWTDPAVATGRDYQRIAASLWKVPLPSLGMGLWVASALARGHRTLLLTAGFAALLLGFGALAAYAYFLDAVPSVLAAISLSAPAEVNRAFLRATLVGIGSSLALIASGVIALRHVRRASAG